MSLTTPPARLKPDSDDQVLPTGITTSDVCGARVEFASKYAFISGAETRKRFSFRTSRWRWQIPLANGIA